MAKRLALGARPFLCDQAVYGSGATIAAVACAGARTVERVASHCDEGGDCCRGDQSSVLALERARIHAGGSAPSGCAAVPHRCIELPCMDIFLDGYEAADVDSFAPRHACDCTVAVAGATFASRLRRGSDAGHCILLRV